MKGTSDVRFICRTPRQLRQRMLEDMAVENHRASIMKKTGSKSLPALARLALAAALSSSDEAIVQLCPPATGVRQKTYR